MSLALLPHSLSGTLPLCSIPLHISCFLLMLFFFNHLHPHPNPIRPSISGGDRLEFWTATETWSTGLLHLVEINDPALPSWGCLSLENSHGFTGSSNELQAHCPSPSSRNAIAKGRNLDSQESVDSFPEAISLPGCAFPKSSTVSLFLLFPLKPLPPFHR